MEQLKVRKKDVIITNAILYLGLSFIFLYLQYAYRHQLSPFSVVYLRKSAELFWYVAIPLVVSSLLIWKHHRFAVFSFSISVFLVAYKVVEGLFIEFNKIIVIATFFYAVISYFLYQLMNHYLDSANINPNFSRSDLFGPLLTRIPITVLDSDKSYPGHLTNWDPMGCFILLEQATKVGARVQIQINFHGRIFIERGEVVAETPDLKGIGIKFESTLRNLESFNWSELIELLDELGYQPERLR